jgi:hypothetical protein
MMLGSRSPSFGALPVNWALEFHKTPGLVRKKVSQLVVLYEFLTNSQTQCNFRNQTDRSNHTLKRQSSTSWFRDPLPSDVRVTCALPRHSSCLTLPRTVVNLPFPLLTAIFFDVLAPTYELLLSCQLGSWIWKDDVAYSQKRSSAGCMMSLWLTVRPMQFQKSDRKQ